MHNRLSPTQDRMDRAAQRTSAAAPQGVATRQASAASEWAGSPGGFGRLGSRLLSDRIHRLAVPAIRSRLTRGFSRKARVALERTGFVLVVLLALAMALLGGCCGPSEAERATVDAIAPEYSAYVQADPRLDAEQKARRLRTIETWQRRVGGK